MWFLCFKGGRNNRPECMQVIAIGAYFRNEMRQHNQLLDTISILLMYVANLLYKFEGSSLFVPSTMAV